MGLISEVKDFFSSLPGPIKDFLRQTTWELSICYFLYESNVAKLDEYLENLREKREHTKSH